jgi:hypothetical protein
MVVFYSHMRIKQVLTCLLPAIIYSLEVAIQKTGRLMKMSPIKHSLSCRFNRLFVRAFFIAGFFILAFSGRAQMPPPLTDVELAAWNFDGTNWLSPSFHNPLMSYTNVANPADWDGAALLVDSTNAAWLQYAIVDGSGQTNMTFNQGSIEFWFMPDWGSGTGPGDWGRLIDVGAYSTNNPSSWFSLYFSASVL